MMIGPTILYSAISILIPFFSNFRSLVALHARQSGVAGSIRRSNAYDGLSQPRPEILDLALAFYVLRIRSRRDLVCTPPGATPRRSR